MHKLTTPVLVFALAACGHQDNSDTTALAREAFDAGEYAQAEDHYARALEAVDESDPDYVALKVEHLQALCFVNGDAALEGFAELEGRATAAHYRKIAMELFNAKAHASAGQVVRAGEEAFPEDQQMTEFAARMVAQMREDDSDAGREFLKGGGCWY